MVYLDTSVLVALLTHEAKSAAVASWYGGCADEFVSAMWCVTEFASALGIKQRTGQLDAATRRTVWSRFERICANDLQLLPLEPTTFHNAALLMLDGAAGLRAGDALHLAAALACRAGTMATLDDVLAHAAQGEKLDLVAFG